MSSEAIGHVFRHSPHKGATFQLLLAIADSANDQNDNEIWMAVTTLADKARMHYQTAHKEIKKLVESGWLEVVIPSESGKIGRYRLVIDRDRESVFEYKKNKPETKTKASKKSKSVAEENKLFVDEELVPGSEVSVRDSDIEPKGTQGRTQETKSLSKASHSTDLEVVEAEVIEAEIIDPDKKIGSIAHWIVKRHEDAVKEDTGADPLWGERGFIAVKKIITEFLQSGRDPSAVEYALNNCQAYTRQGILFVYNQHTKGGNKQQQVKKHNEHIAKQVRELGVDVDAIRAELGF